MPSRSDAERLDRDDPLAPFRSRFVFADDDATIYADGNSLGRLPQETAESLARVVRDQWGRGLVGSWEEWIDLPVRVGNLIGVELLGAAPGTTVVADSTTVNFYKLAVAALRARPRGAVVTDAANFPTNRYVLQGLDRELLLLAPDPSVGDVREAMAGREVALVTLSHVSYRSGARLDLPAITAAAHAAGALVLWDLSHSVGAVPVELGAHHVDLAVGCTYKYLNGGPGAPGFLSVRADLVDELTQPIQGWFGAADQFSMGPEYVPAPGVLRFTSGTPPVLALSAVRAGAAIVAEAGVAAVAEKAARLTSFFIECADDVLAPLGFAVVTPRAAADRGAHVSVRHDEAWRICRALVERLGVVTDFRPPDVVRIGLAPLYSRYVDAWHVVDRLRAAVADAVFEAMPHERRRVT